LLDKDCGFCLGLSRDVLSKMKPDMCRASHLCNWRLKKVKLQTLIRLDAISSKMIFLLIFVYC